MFRSGQDARPVATPGAGSQQRTLEMIQRGRRALCCIRWTVGCAWLALSLAAAALWFFIELQGGFAPDAGCLERLALGALFDLRLLLPSLAPLDDDVNLTRAVLLADVVVVAVALVFFIAEPHAQDAWAEASPWVRCCVVGGGVTYAATTCLMALWAMVQRSPQTMQKWMWRTVSWGLLWNVVRGLLPLIPSRELKRYRADVAWCELPPDLCILCLIYQWGLLRRAQRWLRRLTRVAGSTSAAASIACLIGPGDPRGAYAQATSRFRCVCLADVSRGQLRDNAPDPSLHARARPARLGQCDAFISHSWHDGADAKWAAMQTWRADFLRAHGREPQVWFDKICIDQNKIDVDLRCLPIFLGGCERLVMLVGPTYLSRLWCIFEIFTYIMMGGTRSHVELVPVVSAKTGGDDLGAIVESFDRFDAASCQCFCEEDKSRMLNIVATAFGGLPAFNTEVSRILRRLQREAPWAVASEDALPLSPASSPRSSSAFSAPASGSDEED